MSENFEKSSGNIYADLGLPDAELRLEKANIAYEIGRRIEVLGLTQREAGEMMGIDQPKVSKIVRGDLRGWSLERLVKLARLMGIDVRIEGVEG